MNIIIYAQKWKVSLMTALSLFSITIGMAQTTDFLYHEVTFPANYEVGDYIEFVKVEPKAASASGYYEISIAYSRGYVAAASTHIASISHSNPNLWREVGRVNANEYVSSATNGHNFTVDCNTEYNNARFRVRAINTLGVQTSSLKVLIKIRSINQNSSWTTLNQTGNDLSVDKFLPMTNEWSLYVGKPTGIEGAALAIKALSNGNVGIGTTAPNAKLAVNGNIRAKEVKVETANWPDYVFGEGYKLLDLGELSAYIRQHKHLPGIPTAAEVAREGIDLGEMNRKLLEKVEELTLHLLGEKEQRERLERTVKELIKQTDDKK